MSLLGEVGRSILVLELSVLDDLLAFPRKESKNELLSSSMFLTVVLGVEVNLFD